MDLVANLGVDVRGPNGNPVPVQAGEVVVFYFSAHWCPPCKQFTPLLKKVHALTANTSTVLTPDGQGYTSTPPQRLHMIFVSSDQSEAEMKSYMAESHGRWSYVTFGTPGTEALSTHFNVQGIPAVYVCTPSGASVIPDARAEVMQCSGSEEAAQGLVQRWRVAVGVRPDVLPCGVQVELRGLKQEELNGQMCEVVGADLSNDRVKIRTSCGKVIAVRRDACAQRAYGSCAKSGSVADKSWVGAAAVALSPGEDGFIVNGEQVAAADVVPMVGTVVRIEGLQAKPEKNGAWGTVRSFDASAGRLEVEVSPTEVLKLKPANLRI